MFSLKSRKNEFNNLIWGIALTVFTLFVFAPVLLYMGNQADLEFSAWDFLPYVLIYGISLAVLLLVIGWVLPRKGLAAFAAFVFAAGFALYLQGNYMNAKYGALDGRGINWSGFGSYPLINTIIWILLIVVSIVLALKKEKLFGKIVRYASLLILVIEAVSLAVYFVSTPNPNTEKNYSVSTNLSTSFSRNNNTIVLIVDACDTQYFERMLTEIQEIVDYTIGIYTNHRYLSEDTLGLADNMVRAKTQIGDHWGVSNQLLKFSFFTYFPHALKRYFEFYSGAFEQYYVISTGEELFYKDNYTFQEFCRADFTLTDENAFRFYHITGSHLPCDMDENGQWIGPWKSDAYRQTLGVFKSVKTFFDSLKALDIYDRSTIIVTADHGRFDEGLSFPLL